MPIAGAIHAKNGNLFDARGVLKKFLALRTKGAPPWAGVQILH